MAFGRIEGFEGFGGLVCARAHLSPSLPPGSEDLRARPAQTLQTPETPEFRPKSARSARFWVGRDARARTRNPGNPPISANLAPAFEPVWAETLREGSVGHDFRDQNRVQKVLGTIFRVQIVSHQRWTRFSGRKSRPKSVGHDFPAKHRVQRRRRDPYGRRKGGLFRNGRASNCRQRGFSRLNPGFGGGKTRVSGVCRGYGRRNPGLSGPSGARRRWAPDGDLQRVLSNARVVQADFDRTEHARLRDDALARLAEGRRYGANVSSRPRAARW